MLGAVEARRDGEPLAVPAGKTTELLVRLALDAGAPVRADALIEDLWAEPAGRNTLQSKVSQLRRALGDKDVVRRRGRRLHARGRPGGVDAAAGASSWPPERPRPRGAGDPAAALETGREALALFRGEVLVEAGDWAGPTGPGWRRCGWGWSRT